MAMVFEVVGQPEQSLTEEAVVHQRQRLLTAEVHHRVAGQTHLTLLRVFGHPWRKKDPEQGIVEFLTISRLLSVSLNDFSLVLAQCHCSG